MKQLSLPDELYDLLRLIAKERGHESIADFILLCINKSYRNEVDQLASEAVKDMLDKVIDPAEVLERWVNIQEAVAIINAANKANGRSISYQGVWDALKNKRLRGMQMGRSWFVDPDDAKRYIITAAGPHKQD